MFTLDETPLAPEALKATLLHPEAGGFVSFEGWVRNHNEGKSVSALAYEAFAPLALSEGQAILAEVRARFDILDCAAAHRTGHLEIGELAVWVGVAAAHRRAAFEACQYIIDEIKVRLPIWKQEFYTDGDSDWVNCPTCAEHPSHPTPDLTEAQYYSRQRLLKAVGLSGQVRLKESRVLVVGAGGLGCGVLPYLVAAGVGTVGICEADALAPSNLHRQVLYDAADVGELKGALVMSRLQALNPWAQLAWHPERLTTENAADVLKNYDLVLDCTDSLETKLLLNAMAYKMGFSLILASLYQYEGELQLIVPGQSPACLHCLWPELPEPGCVGTCAEVGVLGPVPGVFGTLQAMEALKWLLGLPTPLVEQVMLFDLLDLSVRKIHRTARPGCLVCAQAPALSVERPMPVAETVELDPATLSEKALLAFDWMDLREPGEGPEVDLALYSPTSRPFSSTFWETPELALDRETLLVCTQGRRSLALAQELRGRGYQRVYSLKGGVVGLQQLLSPLAPMT